MQGVCSSTARRLLTGAAVTAALFAASGNVSAADTPTDPTAAMAAIGVIPPPAPADACVMLTRPLHPGDVDGDDGDVSCLQAQLAAAQIPLVEATGEFDGPTKLAVETWQTLMGLTVDGWVGAQTAPTLGFTWNPPAPPAAAPAPFVETDNGSAAVSTDGSDDTPTGDPESCLGDVRAGAAAVANAMNMPLADIATGDLGGDVGRFWGSSDLAFGDITIDCSAKNDGYFGTGAHEQAHWVVLAAGFGNSECATESVAALLTGADSGFYSRCDPQGQQAIDQFFFYWG